MVKYSILKSFSSQYLCNRPIVVQYAFKKETRGERHGSAAERLLAGSNPDRARINAMMASLNVQNIPGMMPPMQQPGMMPPMPPMQQPMQQ